METVPAIELPPCELGRLEEISELVSSCLPSPMKREKLAVAVENEGYIKKLLNLFHMCEDLDNMEGLHHLYDIFKNVFLLNKNALFELMFAEDTIFDVVGCLEFDPGLPTPKRHRQYLRSIAQFHQVLPISNPELMSKIHQTYRVQYIQDVVLPTPSVFEENMLSTLSSFIFFNKVDIVSQIQEDEKFLDELFTQLKDDKTDETRRMELVLFLKEFCTFSQTLQQQAREQFYKTLNSLEVLKALEITLASQNRRTKTASIDILLFIVDFSPSMVREYMLQQLSNSVNDSLLMNVIIEQMSCDNDPEMGNGVQLTGIIRTLLDPENMLASPKQSEKTDFLNFFYKHCMHVFIAPLLANTADDQPETNDPCTVQLLSLILELLSFCVEFHTYHIKNYILHKDLLRRILVLMKSQHMFLVLCALRFMRKIIHLKDEFYNRYITKGNLFAPVIDALVMNKGRYNLLDSAILEMFEHIRVEDIKTLCTHVVEHFGQTLDKIQYVSTFKNLRQRYDQHQDRTNDGRKTQLENVGSILRPGKFRRDPRQLDEEEEMWFNDDDYEDDSGNGGSSGGANANVLHPGGGAAGAMDAMSAMCGGASSALEGVASPLEAAAAVAAQAGASVGFSAVVDSVTESSASTSGASSGTSGSSAKKSSLVDYDSDEEDEVDEDDEDDEDIVLDRLNGATTPDQMQSAGKSPDGKSPDGKSPDGKSGEVTSASDDNMVQTTTTSGNNTAEDQTEDDHESKVVQSEAEASSKAEPAAAPAANGDSEVVTTATGTPTVTRSNEVTEKTRQAEADDSAEADEPAPKRLKLEDVAVNNSVPAAEAAETAAAPATTAAAPAVVEKT